MHEGIAGMITGVIFFIVTGLVLVTYFYFRSKEKQMMIERGMSYEQMVEFLKTKRNPFTFLKIGIIIFMLGVGIGTGVLIEESNGNSGWIPLLIFGGTGLGFVLAFYATKKYEVDNRTEYQEKAE